MSVRSAVSTPASTVRRIPGEAGVWILILGDMTVFALLFGVFIHARADDPVMFETGRQLLNQNFGAINTLFLLTSSLFVVAGVQAVRNRMEIAPKLFMGAMVFGACFAGVKFLEWGEKISAHHGPGDGDFFMYYYILTGVHFFHLLVGMGVLTFMVWQSRRRDELDEAHIGYVMSGAVFWHMVDLLWIVLFPLIYLMH